MVVTLLIIFQLDICYLDSPSSFFFPLFLLFRYTQPKKTAVGICIQQTPTRMAARDYGIYDSRSLSAGAQIMNFVFGLYQDTQIFFFKGDFLDLVGITHPTEKVGCALVVLYDSFQS